MANLDTRQKRESGFGILLPFTRVLPLVDGSDADSEDERAHLVMNYNGIPTAAAANEEIEQARSISRFIFSGVFGRVN